MAITPARSIAWYLSQKAALVCSQDFNLKSLKTSVLQPWSVASQDSGLHSKYFLINTARQQQLMARRSADHDTVCMTHQPTQKSNAQMFKKISMALYNLSTASVNANNMKQPLSFTRTQ